MATPDAAHYPATDARSTRAPKGLGMDGAFTDIRSVELVLYTDALIARGTIATRQRRISDILNLADSPLLVLESVTVTDLDGHGPPIVADVAQINLDAVLFAVADARIEPQPELRSPRMQHEAIVSIPPFRVTGTLHLLAGAANLREAITDLTTRFVPVTDAEFSAPSLGLEPREAVMLAVNHQRAQILARYTRAGDRPAPPSSAGDPWANQTSDTLAAPGSTSGASAPGADAASGAEGRQRPRSRSKRSPHSDQPPS